MSKRSHDGTGKSVGGSGSTRNIRQFFGNATGEEEDEEGYGIEGSEYPGIFRGPLAGELSPLPILEEDGWIHVDLNTEEVPGPSSSGPENCASVGPQISDENRVDWKGIYNRGFLLSPARCKIIHDIYEGVHDGNDLLRINRINGRIFNGSVYLIVEHNGHFHVLHDCNPSRNGCRCARILQWTEEFGPRRSRRFIRTASITSGYWENITNYFQDGERKIIHLEIARRAWISSDSSGRIRFQKCYRQG